MMDDVVLRSRLVLLLLVLVHAQDQILGHVDPLTLSRADPRCWESASVVLLEMRTPRIAHTVPDFWDFMVFLKASDNRKHGALFWDLAQVFWDLYVDCIRSRSHGLGRRHIMQTKRRLLSLRTNHDLLHPGDSSLLVELLKIIKRDKLIRDLRLDPQLSSSRVSPYRQMLFKLSENISDDELDSIKFMLQQSFPRRKLQQEVTILQLFLEMEKECYLAADNLGIMERIVGNVCPHLRKIIQFYQKENARGHSFCYIPTRYISTLSSIILYYVAGLEQYRMNGDWRGFALIINNQYFSDVSKLKNRPGSDIDEKFLVSVFQWLGFETVLKPNCSKENMLAALDELRKRDHTQADCVVCCVLTHGFEGGLYGVDGEKVLIMELLKLLDGLNCGSLLQKPKLFFIQACQGQREQQGITLQSDDSNNTAETCLSSDAEVPREVVPIAADYLVAMATVPGYVSFRDKLKGTWFIQTLCKKMTQLVPR
ncbi:Caspase-8 [Bagarius yarrelli]|uniref:Caspase-8 n=1 Tax=Bagarius yarrelli TaxID=175774 RepID=A0A556U4N7_BAGYA|nr:Caspase-8 [Bagarius yarrelli]